MTAATKTEYTALIDGPLPTAGAIVWWRLVGGLDLAALQAAWESEGLATAWLPEPPSPATALRRAVTEERTQTRLLRPLKNGALALVDEREVGGELQYEPALRIALDPVGRPVFKYLRGSEYDTGDRIRDSYDKHLEQVSQADVSAWLTRMMDRLRAVPLRETGGIYFVPRFGVDDWERLVRAVRTAGKHVISYVPALRSDEAAKAVLDAVTLEAEKMVTGMAAELARGALGARALQTRIGQADAVHDKVARYEALFGAELDGMRAAIQGLRAQLSVAMLAASAAAEDETH